MTTTLRRYTGDELHGFMFPDYQSDEPRWIDGKDYERVAHSIAMETITALGRRILVLETALGKIEAGEMMTGRTEWTLADLIQEHYRIARTALAEEPIKWLSFAKNP